MKRLLILCGGQSPEHPISVRSTKNILKALDRSKYEVILVGITQEGIWQLLREQDLGEVVADLGSSVVIVPGTKDFLHHKGRSLGAIDVVFPILHGPNGEDGTVQGLLKLLKVPFVGPAVLGSAAAMDKDVTKRLLQNHGLKVAPWVVVLRGQKLPTFESVKSTLGSPVFVKPANMGSSVGVHRVESEAEWLPALKDALKYDRKVLVERNIVGRELECAVLGNENPKASGLGEVKSGNFYSFDEKYADSSVAQTIIPAELEANQIANLRDVATRAYQALDCSVLSRVDMFLTESGEIYVNEINTIPGFTSISMYPKLWEAEGISYSDLIDRLLKFAEERG